MVHRYGRRGASSAIVVAALLLGAAIGPSGIHPGTEQDAWNALQRGGHVAVVRRAASTAEDRAPSALVPDCGGRPLLSPDGVAQARRIGEEFRARNVAVDAVYASQWCAAAETAAELGLGPVKPFPALNSFTGQTDRKQIQMAALTPWVANAAPQGNLVLVTHGGVATALTDLVPSDGEIIVLKPLGDSKIAVVGRITPPM